MKRLRFDRHGDLVDVDDGVPARALELATPLAIEVHRPVDDMALPAGATCSDCANFHRCAWLISCEPTSSLCDWAPSRFRPGRPLPAAPPLPLAARK